MAVPSDVPRRRPLTFLCPPQITGGKAHEKATLSGITVADKTTNLCSDLESTDIPCPVAAGPTTSVATVTIGDVPSGGWPPAPPVLLAVLWYLYMRGKGKGEGGLFRPLKVACEICVWVRSCTQCHGGADCVSSCVCALFFNVLISRPASLLLQAPWSPR